MRRFHITQIATALLALALPASSQEFRAGVSKVRITPPVPFQLSGYSSRTNLATEVRNDLWAKALALQSTEGGRAVIITTDLIGLPKEVSEEVAQRAKAKHGLARSELLLNSAHIHSGPMVWPNLRNMFDATPERIAPMERYSRDLADKLLELIGTSLADLQPAKIAVAHDSANFAVNRREPTPNGFKLGVNPSGPTDHDVPVLTVRAADGRLRAMLFGYACHNTTLTGTWNVIDGDYAGAAQRQLESSHPGAVALFIMLCGGDQNPNPRNTIELAEDHGRALAAAVERALASASRSVCPPIRTAYRLTTIEYAAHSRETFVAELSHKSAANRRRAAMMIASYDNGSPVRDASYPVQAIRLGDDFCLLGLGGEVVVDYALRSKREYAHENLVVAGYCNDVMGYIPTARILKEGGYEPCGSTVYYAQPGPFSQDIEETIFASIRHVMAEVGATVMKPTGRSTP